MTQFEEMSALTDPASFQFSVVEDHGDEDGDGMTPAEAEEFLNQPVP